MEGSLKASSKEKTPSLRSVGSNSSLSSAVSLTRRPRTRTRSRTVTGGQPDSASLYNGAAAEAFFSKPIVAEPDGTMPSTPPPSSSLMPARPATADAHIPDAKFWEGAESSGTGALTMAKQMSLPVEPRSKHPPSAFVVAIQNDSPNVRDSMLSQNSTFTQQSGVSSSLYPPSTSTASGTESPPSPMSIVFPEGDMDVPIMDDLQEYDGDDVSYRLRLLVKNNYFLPPAHSKPSAADFAPSPHLQKKTSAPNFFDMFRGKSKSKPSTPMVASPLEQMPPVLRTTSDPNTAAYVAYKQPRSSVNIPRPSSASQDRSGRVVVVREKMVDLVSAAKQAEQDMKNRGGRQGSQRGQQDTFDDVIDPTDAVDLPPPSAQYPFAVQASALHGLGVEDSVGAALLADRLPPPNSQPDPEDDWRKALLKAAVGHSLDNLHRRGDSTPNSPLSPQSFSPSPAPIQLMGQRIINRPVTPEDRTEKGLSQSSRSVIQLRQLSSGMSSPDEMHEQRRPRGLSSSDRMVEQRPTSYIPLRSETPVTPILPLSPPPRRIINPLYSLSQTDLSLPQPTEPPPPLPPFPMSPEHAVRKAITTSGLSSTQVRLTPPPLGADRTYSDRSRSSFETSLEHFAESIHAESLYSEGDGDASTTMSYYSQLSPTASAFHDALGSNSRSESALSHHIHSAHDRLSSDESDTMVRDNIERHTMSTPPPRASTSTPSFALSPPPRSSYLHQKKGPSRLLQTVHSPNLDETRSTSIEILEPAPTTPPYIEPPTIERRAHILSALQIPSSRIAPSIHSAPPPTAPPSFFDSIQTQPNAMDDLDSSDESGSGDEDEDEDESSEPLRRSHQSDRDATSPGSTHLYVEPRTRKISSTRDSLMRLGNHSTPYVARTLPFGATDPSLPIGNVSTSQPRAFFAERLAERPSPGAAPLSSSFDFFKYAQEHPLVSDHAGSSVATRGSKHRPTTADENSETLQHKQRQSLKRLDGLLIQHMVAEKDRLKRIATNIQTSNSQTP